MKRALFAALVLLGGACPASAHHSATAEFDVAHRTTISGTLTRVDWVNPHIVVFVDAKGASGPEAWKFQSQSPAWFRRFGVTRVDFSRAMGQTITVEGNRAKDGSLIGFLLKATFADGRSVAAEAPQPRGAGAER